MTDRSIFRESKSVKSVRLIFLLIVVSLCTPLWAQDSDPSLSTQLRDGYFFPASPEAASMVRYGSEAKPDYHTGAIGLSIPVYTYKDHDFEIPVNLCYGSSGYQPGNDPGSVGNGWYLSCGGAITREVRGLPDESRSRFFSPKSDDGLTVEGMISVLQSCNASYWQIQHAISLYNESIRPKVDGYARRHLDLVELSDSIDFAYNNELGSEFMMCNRITDYGYANSFVEIEPDIYHYSFLGYTGSFILQPGEKVLILETNSPSGNVDITYHWQESLPIDGTYFTISFGDGYKYDFNCREEVHSFSDADGQDDGNRSIGCWKLSRITAPNNRIAEFGYLSNSQIHQVSYLAGINIDHTTMYSSGSNPTRLWLEPTYPNEKVTVTNTVQPCLLQTVSVSGGTTISFTYESSGQRRFLEGIEVRNSSNTLVRSCTLNSVGITGSQVRFLKSVSIPGQGVWSFDYVGEDSSCYGRADDMAWLTDWGGYYNGQSFKNTVSGSSSGSLSGKAATLKAARQPSLSNSSLTMLFRVTWPTGGKSVFTYGQNTYKYVCSLPGMNPEPVSERLSYGLRLISVDNYDNDGSQLQHISYNYDKGALLRKPMIYFNYSIGSENLNFDREVVNTLSNLGYGKDSHLVYDKVTEKISRTASSPTTETATNVYEFYGAGEGETSVFIGNGYTMPWTFVDWDFEFTDNGTEWDTFRNWTGGVYSGQLKRLVCYKGADADTVKVSRVVNTVDSYPQKWVADEAALQNRTPYVEWPTVWECSSAHCVTVNPRSAYLRHYEKEIFDTNGNLLYSIPTTVTVDGIGRITGRQTIDSSNRPLLTDFQYVSSTPFVQSITKRRNGLFISRRGFTYTQRSCPAGTYYRPLTITRTATGAGEVGQVQTVTSFTAFDQWDNVTRSVDALGNQTDYTWDTSGQYLTSLKLYPDGNAGQALTTSWGWIPLVGVSSITTPGGKTVNYSYDSCGRLSGISDTGGHPLQQFSYYITNTLNSYSWTKTRTFRTASEHADDIMYYNGLGYPVMQRMANVPGGYEIGTAFSYDVLMRENRMWCPAAFEDLDFSESDWAESFLPAENYVLTYNQDLYGREPESDEERVPVRPFSDTVYEFSTEGRPLGTSLPGEQYYLHPTTYDYLAAVIDGRNVTGVKTTDGDGRVSIEWKDYEDRIVAADRYTGDTTARTFFRYDWRGNLTEVVTPGGNRYLYAYDSLSRMTSRTIPGKAVETFSYDDLDRITSSRDGNQRAGGVTIRYYYDNVGNLISKKAEKNNVLRALEEYTYSPLTGLKTGERFYRLTDDGWVSGSDYISRAYTYDNEERVIRVVETDYPQGYSLTTVYAYDLQGNVTTSIETCAKSNVTLAVTTERGYDARSRPTSETLRIGNDIKSTIAFSYDELGRPYTNYYGSGSDRISESMGYTIQGWPSYKGGNLMTQSYGYEETASPGWTGNITRWDWRHLATPAEGTSYAAKSESFTYDAQNRLSGSSMTSGGQNVGNAWSERNISYDLDGNILHLDRYQEVSATPDVALNFTYNDGNRRSGYNYDDNGNITYDPLRNFEIKYNLLNLASDVRIPEVSDGGPQGPINLAETVFYADGTRAGVIDSDNGDWISRYIGSLIYSGSEGIETLEGIVTENGFIDCSGGVSNAQMQYFLRDHLGSVRVIATDRNNVLSRTDYLPSGVRMTGNGLAENATARSSWFGFGGKENEMWNSQYGTAIPHWLRGERYQHFGARAYDPFSCIFMQTDPLAEKYYGVSPYAYCGGNPVNRVDPDGRNISDYYSLSGKLLKTIDDGSDKKFFLLYSKRNYIDQSIAEGKYIEVPNDAILSAMDKVYSLTEKTGKEHGFRVGENNGVSVIVMGDESSISSTQWLPAVDDLREKIGEYVAYDVHSHPKDNEGSTNKPSPTDIENTVGNKPNYVLGYSATEIVGAGAVGDSEKRVIHTRSISVYNRSGQIGETIDYTRFKRSSAKINKR